MAKHRKGSENPCGTTSGLGAVVALGLCLGLAACTGWGQVNIGPHDGGVDEEGDIGGRADADADADIDADTPSWERIDAGPSQSDEPVEDEPDADASPEPDTPPPDNEPDCSPTAETICDDGDLHYLDSCGAISLMADDCDDDLGCEYGECVEEECHLSCESFPGGWSINIVCNGEIILPNLRREHHDPATGLIDFISGECRDGSNYACRLVWDTSTNTPHGTCSGHAHGFALTCAF